MKYLKIILINLVLLLLLVVTPTSDIKAIEGDNPQVVYFYDTYCEGCQDLIGGPFYLPTSSTGEVDTSNENYDRSSDYIQKIKDEGIDVIYLRVTDTKLTTLPSNIVYDSLDDLIMLDVTYAFYDAYDVPITKQSTPIIFAGDTFYPETDIKSAIDNGELFSNASSPLLPVEILAGDAVRSIEGFGGFLFVIFAGLLDGFNPCAIALLLMFISLIGFTKDKKILIIVSLTYIISMFVTYLLIGLGLLTAIEAMAKESILRVVVEWAMLILVSFFFIYNLYDYFVTRNQEYGKVKNQLPRWIQRMNKKIMKTFSGAMSEGEEKGKIVSIVILTMTLGVVMSFTELLCTGQIYGTVAYAAAELDGFYPYFALICYNIMFVSPMIVIAIISVKSEGIMTVSNWIRDHLHIIKLANAVLFLLLILYYSFRLFGN